MFSLGVGEKLLGLEEAKFIFIQNNGHPFGVNFRGKHGQLKAGRQEGRKEERKEGRKKGRRKDESDAKDKRNPKNVPCTFPPRITEIILSVPCLEF